MNIFISGLTGSGKSAAAGTVAARLGWTLIEGAAIRTRLLGISLESKEPQAFWRFSKEAAELDQHRLVSPTADKRIEEALLKMARDRERLVFDVWFASFLVESSALKVWLEAPLEIRAARVAASNGVGEDAALAAIQRKDEAAIKLGAIAYGIDLLSNHAGFDLIIDTHALVEYRPEDVIHQAAHERWPSRVPCPSPALEIRSLTGIGFR